MKLKYFLLLLIVTLIFPSESQARRVVSSVETIVLDYNGEVSRFLNHMAYAGWTDEIVKAHSSPDMAKNYKTGEFLKYKPYGRLMGYKGITSLDGDENKADIWAIAVFEKKEVDVHIVVQKYGKRYLINVLEIKPIRSKNNSLDAPLC